MTQHLSFFCFQLSLVDTALQSLALASYMLASTLSLALRVNYRYICSALSTITPASAFDKLLFFALLCFSIRLILDQVRQKARVFTLTAEQSLWQLRPKNFLGPNTLAFCQNVVILLNLSLIRQTVNEFVAFTAAFISCQTLRICFCFYLKTRQSNASFIHSFIHSFVLICSET